MRLKLLAVAREPKKDPLGEAAKDYLKRAQAVAPSLGLKGPEERFLPPTKGNDPAKEADLLGAAIAGQAVLLDERGAMLSSPAIAELIAKKRDAGVPELAFCIGGADGFDQGFREDMKRAGGTLLAFGKAVWPHALCRVMLAEQIYRSLAILSNHPYHRGG